MQKPNLKVWLSVVSVDTLLPWSTVKHTNMLGIFIFYNINIKNADKTQDDTIYSEGIKFTVEIGSKY